MVILHYILLLLGCVYLITQSIIFRIIRKLVAKLGTVPTILIYCPACTAFWVGATLGLLGMWPFESNLYLAVIQSGIGSTALGALWKEYGPSDDIYSIEQGSHQDGYQEQKEESYGKN